jgi:uncharacterized protein (TIGR00297 family)
LAATLLGWIFLINPRPELIAFPVLFFLIGSLLSKLPGPDDEGSHRNANQVFANGGVPALFFMAYFIWQESVFLIAGISGFTFALSDTAASEIGIRMGGKHYRIIGWNRVDEGLSGAVTVSGSLAGLGFAIFMSIVAGFFGLGIIHCAIIALAGIIGNIADSLIGDLLQAKYVDANGQFRENPTDSRKKPVRGYRLITNSATNFLASAIACIIGLIAAKLI